MKNIENIRKINTHESMLIDLLYDIAKSLQKIASELEDIKHNSV